MMSSKQFNTEFPPAHCPTRKYYLRVTYCLLTELSKKIVIAILKKDDNIIETSIFTKVDFHKYTLFFYLTKRKIFHISLFDSCK